MLLCSGQALHTSLCYPGSASWEVLILPGSLQAVQARVSSFHGQPTESWEISSYPQEVSSLLALLVPSCFHCNPSIILVSTHSCFCSLQVPSLWSSRPHLLLCCDISLGLPHAAPSLKNNFSLLIHLWTLYWKVFCDTCTSPPPLQQNSSFLVPSGPGL